MKSLKTLPRILLACAFFLLLGGSLACSSGNPIAPSGTVLTITVSPSRIGLDGTATVTVTGRRPDGNPLPDGTEIRFSTSLGVIDSLVETDNAGVARATLRADGRPGTATVTASTGGETEATIDVAIGEPAETQPLVAVTVNPDNIPVGEDSTATVTVVVRNADGTQGAAGLPVILTATLGSLDPSSTVTDGTGTATSTLSAGLQSGTAEIAAFVGSADRVTTSLNIRDAAADISLQPNPTSIPRTDFEIRLVAFVSNTQGLPFQGQSVTFLTEVGSFVNNVAFTDNSGQAQVTLSVTQAQLGELDFFRVRARTPTGNGQFIEADAVINIQ